MRIAPGIHRIGDSSIINAYLVEEANEVTIVDAGVSGLYRDLPRELASMGRSIADVRALVLTHGHSDHIGFAERLRSDRHIPVSVHEADAALAPRSPASCGSRSCAVAFEHITCARSRRSATARRSTCPGPRSSPSPPATRRGAPCSTSDP
jgi:glyoxylase-like metal-dependent hydrolase (beta-lactamase superfamily II)